MSNPAGRDTDDHRSRQLPAAQAAEHDVRHTSQPAHSGEEPSATNPTVDSAVSAKDLLSGLRMSGRGNPDGAAIRTGYLALRYHLEYLGWLAETRKWLAGSAISLADFTAAAHLSCLDYIGDVDWNVSQSARDWYARMKSRPSFRGVLADRVPGMAAPAHYVDLDF